MHISVIIPFYKEIDLISRTISSVYNQIEVWGNNTFEIIIGNDGGYSESAILSVIHSEQRAFVKVVSNPGPKGAGGARNAALRHAAGDLIAFLDADDYWSPGKIKLQMRKISHGATFVATSYRFEDADVVISPPVSLECPADVFMKLGVGTSTVLMTKELVLGHFFQEIKYSQDLDFWYRLSKSQDFVYAMVPDSCVVYSRQGSTRNKFVQLRYFWKVLALNNIDMFTRIIALARYSFRGIINHYLRSMIGK